MTISPLAYSFAHCNTCHGHGVTPSGRVCRCVVRRVAQAADETPLDSSTVRVAGQWLMPRAELRIDAAWWGRQVGA